MTSTYLLLVALGLQGAPAGGQSPSSTAIPPKFHAPAPGPATVVATVDGQKITGKEVEGYLWEWFGAQASQDLINLVAVRREAAKDGIKVTESEVVTRMTSDLEAYDKRTQNNSQIRPPGTTVEELLERQGFPASRLYINTEIEVIVDAIAEKTFDPKGFYDISMMAFRPDTAAAGGSAAAADAAKAADDRLKKGDKWETVFATANMPPQYAANDGHIGWVDFATFPIPVQQALKPLRPGQFSEPVEVGAAWEIFRLDGLGAEATGPGLEELKRQYAVSKQRSVLANILAAAKVVRFPAKEGSQEESPNRLKGPKPHKS